MSDISINYLLHTHIWKTDIDRYEIWTDRKLHKVWIKSFYDSDSDQGINDDKSSLFFKRISGVRKTGMWKWSERRSENENKKKKKEEEEVKDNVKEKRKSEWESGWKKEEWKREKERQLVLIQGWKWGHSEGRREREKEKNERREGGTNEGTWRW